jgi:predicted ATPase/class 3 adenylate cyclase
MSMPTASGALTFLFTDIEGSTRLWEQYPEAMKSALARHDALLTQAISANNGHVIKTTGDGCLAIFPNPLSALNAALAAQQALSAEPWDELKPQCVRVRMALHSGSADERGGDFFGPTLNRTARLMTIGHGGQVLLSASVETQVRESMPSGASLLDLGNQRLKDLTRPEHVYQLAHPGLRADFPALTSLDSFPNNLPVQLTSFVGRERAIDEVKHLLDASHLLTLTGSGGTGKTRLALQTAAEVLPSFVDGVWLVELAPLTSPDLIAPAIGNLFGLDRVPNRTPREQLIDYLRSRRLLLILDNCEHLVAACASLADALLRSCPHLRIIASSREALGIAGEATYRVPSLKLPALSDTSPEALRLCEAAQLFIERATIVNPRFALNERNAVAIAQICRHLDGIPLAIELAAARVKLFSAEQIVARLDDRFRLLTSGSRTALPRQQTLRAMIDWSYDLLSEPERGLLSRLSVFASGWTFEAAEAVCADLDVLDLLSQLVNKSLVVAEERADEESGEVRYRMLETIREYAHDKLLDAGSAEVSAARDCHFEYFLSLTDQARLGLRGAQAVEWSDRLDPEEDNIRVAVEWGQDKRPGDVLRMLGNLIFTWRIRLDRMERLYPVSDLIQQVDALPPSSDPGVMQTRSSLKAEGLTVLGLFALTKGDNRSAYESLVAAVALERTLQDPVMRAFMLSVLTLAATYTGNVQAARSAAAECTTVLDTFAEHDPVRVALSLFLSMRMWVDSMNDKQSTWEQYRSQVDRMVNEANPLLVAPSLNAVGFTARSAGDFASARLYYERGIKLGQRLRSRSIEAAMSSQLAQLCRMTGDLQEAERRYKDSILKWKDLGHRAAVSHELECLGFIARAGGRFQRAACLLGAAEALRESSQNAMIPSEREEYDREVASLHTQMNAADFTSAWTVGRAMKLHEAVDYARK